jgi:hypothetical protein
VICSEAKKPDDDPEFVVCGFSRRAAVKSAQTAIEYCLFNRYVDGVSGQPWCIKVARKDNSGTWILASHYTYYGRLDGEGGGEAGVKCHFPDKSTEELKEKYGDFLIKYLGESSKYSAQLQPESGPLPHYEFRGTGLKIRDDQENVFKRIHVYGLFYRELLSSFDTVFVHFSVTISAQASDNIIDYREPNEAMSNRLRNRFVQRIREFSKDISTRSACGWIDEGP